MAKHIKLITKPITAYVSQRFAHALRGNKAGKSNELPPHLEWARLRGEALLTERFFNYFERKHIDDVNSQLFFWQQFKSNPNALLMLSRKTGLIAAFRAQVSPVYLENTTEVEQHFIAYCCLLWDIHQQQNQALLATATETFFGHFSASIFPTEYRSDDVDKLKQEIRKLLAQRWNIRPEIRESFTTDDSKVNFSLIAQIKGSAPCQLHSLEGKRLKPTRIKAYQTVLQQLKDGSLELEAPKNCAVK